MRLSTSYSRQREHLLLGQLGVDQASTGLKIVGSVSAEGAVEVNGHVDGDLHYASPTVSPKASINGSIHARLVVVNGTVEGPIRGEAVVLNRGRSSLEIFKLKSLAIERGGPF